MGPKSTQNDGLARAKRTVILHACRVQAVTVGNVHKWPYSGVIN